VETGKKKERFLASAGLTKWVFFPQAAKQALLKTTRASIIGKIE
jgi:hypothetical protein